MAFVRCVHVCVPTLRALITTHVKCTRNNRLNLFYSFSISFQFLMILVVDKIDFSEGYIRRLQLHSNSFGILLLLKDVSSLRHWNLNFYALLCIS